MGIARGRDLKVWLEANTGLAHPVSCVAVEHRGTIPQDIATMDTEHLGAHGSFLSPFDPSHTPRPRSSPVRRC